eukprot:764796-Hanusia_phi.AAC.5
MIAVRHHRSTCPASVSLLMQEDDQAEGTVYRFLAHLNPDPVAEPAEESPTNRAARRQAMRNSKKNSDGTAKVTNQALGGDEQADEGGKSEQEDLTMSLTMLQRVSPELIEIAQLADIPDEEFGRKAVEVSVTEGVPKKVREVTHSRQRLMPCLRPQPMMLMRYGNRIMASDPTCPRFAMLCRLASCLDVQSAASSPCSVHPLARKRSLAKRAVPPSGDRQEVHQGT